MRRGDVGQVSRGVETGPAAERFLTMVDVPGHGPNLQRLPWRPWDQPSRPVGRVWCAGIPDQGGCTNHVLWPAAEISAVLIIFGQIVL